MKRVMQAFIVAILFAVIGCSNINPDSSYSVGKNFPSENVSQIERDKTTGNEITQMFGEPFSKTIISANEEKWIYSYSSGSTKFEGGFISSNVQTTSQRKVLGIMLKDGMVTDFTYTEGTEPQGIFETQ